MEFPVLLLPEVLSEPPSVCNTIPSPPNRLMTRPLTVLPPAVILSPLAEGPALVPFSSIMGLSMKPGCVVPSITTGPVMVSSGEFRLIVCGPEPMSNRISSRLGPVGAPMTSACSAGVNTAFGSVP